MNESPLKVVSKWRGAQCVFKETEDGTIWVRNYDKKLDIFTSWEPSEVPRWALDNADWLTKVHPHPDAESD